VNNAVDEAEASATSGDELEEEQVVREAGDGQLATSTTDGANNAADEAEASASSGHELEEVQIVTTNKWMQLVDELNDNKFDQESLKLAGIRDLFPCEYCPGKNPDPSKEESWRRCVLRKVEKHLWEVMDVTATEVYEVVEDDEDSGPIAEWNMYYRRPTVTSMEKAREDAKAEQIDAMEADEEIMESPRRKRMRGKAFESQQKQAEGMKKRARKVDGKVKEGNIVQIGLSTVDSMKVDSKNLTLVVVEITEKGMYRLAAKNGVLKNVYPRHVISLVKNATKELMGLEDAYNGWRGMSKITEREVARATSIVEGQGMMKCSCKGNCSSNSCKCRKAGRICNSRCHRGSSTCTNHDEDLQE
jgi:hypothetical protein